MYSWKQTLIFKWHYFIAHTVWCKVLSGRERERKEERIRDKINREIEREIQRERKRNRGVYYTELNF